MATKKVTITLPEEQVEEIRALVAAGRTPNVSAFVQHAVGLAFSDIAGWRQMLDEALEKTGGPMTDDERRWADSILSPPPRRGGSRRRRAA